MEKFKNLKPEELFQGKTFENIQQKCFDLCRLYMGNHSRWQKYLNKLDDLQVDRILGGMTNQLYSVALKNVPDHHKDDKITIKFYQLKINRKNLDNVDPLAERENDLVISLITSERKLGPKVFGVFHGGIIQSYHEHEQFRVKHQQNDVLLRKVAHKLAEMNNLDIPIEKNRFHCLEMVNNYVSIGYKKMAPMFEAMNIPYMKNFLDEYKWFDSFIRQYNECPTVFSHNDFRGCNILVCKDSNELIICDYEYSSYGLRGLDFATFLWEWGRETMDFTKTDLPPNDVIEKFVNFYREGYDLIEPGYSSKPENSTNKIIENVKVGFLFLYAYICAIFMNQPDDPNQIINFDATQKAGLIAMMFKVYLDLKETLIKEKIIPN